MTLTPVEIAKYEEMPYPDMDTKRMVIDNAIAVTLNNVIWELERIRNRPLICKSLVLLFSGAFLIFPGSLIFPYPLMIGVALTGVFFVVLGGYFAIFNE